MLYKPSLKLEHHSHDREGRLLIAKFTSCVSDGTEFQVINLYGPNRKQEGDEFFESLSSQYDPSLPTILCGDFNTVPDPLLDRSGCNPSSNWAYSWPKPLSTLLTEGSLRDVWREKHPDTRAYTWHRPNGTQASRLDMFWISSFLLPLVLDIDIFPFFRSDHSYVFLRLTLPSMPKRGPGVWKFNVSSLKDDGFTNQVREFWNSWQLEKSSFPSLAVWWDAGKQRLKNLTRKYSKKQAAARRLRIRSLENTLYHLQRRQDSGEDVTRYFNETKTELELEHLHCAEGAKIRARERWAEEGETSSSYFLRQEKSKASKKLFTAIRNTSGVVVHSVAAIIRVWCLFYVHLFSASTLDLQGQTFFLDALELSLSDADSALCEGQITEEECRTALTGLKNNKSPGVDGLPYEFYKHFWHLLSNDLVAVLNSCLADGKLSFSQRVGLITLLYKKGDRLDTKNWRPISLLCTDYKILSKVLTNRLLTVLPSVINFPQTCGVPGRFSGENIRLLEDIVHYSNFNDLPAAVISLDQEKAFDRVDWRFMLRVLERMNFGPSFRSWVSLLYTEIFSAVLVNGFKSHPFAVTRGVRQGCPLSPLLYVIVAETIASAIKKDHAIDGFQLTNGKVVKIFQYADDTTILVQSDHSLLSLFSLFDRYERASGAKLNVQKSHGLLLGAWRNRTDLPVALNWSSDSITVLGCRLSNDHAIDWDPLLAKFEGQLSLWKQRQLSFRGRALIANVLGLSIFWYQATTFDVPKTVIHAINKILFPFVWGKKREWLARSSVTQPKLSGGLGVVDVSRKVSSLRAVWFRRFFTEPPHPWTIFFEYFVFQIFGIEVKELLARDSIPAYRIRKLPPFYASLLRAWVELKGSCASGTYYIPNPCGEDAVASTITAKKSYSILSHYEHVEHKSVAKFSEWHIPVNWREAWVSLRLWRFVRSVQDTSWLSFHGILPTADRLIRFQMAVDPLCFCGSPESLLHLFISCPLARELLDWFLRNFRKFEPQTVTLSSGEILFGFTGRTHRHVPIVFTALMGVLRHHIWLARNCHRFDHIVPSGQDTLRKAKSTFRFLVRMHKRHCPRHQFTTEWLADGIIGSLTTEDWVHFSRDFVT